LPPRFGQHVAMVRTSSENQHENRSWAWRRFPAMPAFGRPARSWRRRLGVAMALTPFIAGAGAGSVAAQAPRAHAAYAQQCSQSYPARRDPSNPLMLARSPGSNPLSGASFFVDGPRHGVAAGAIARLLGVDPTSFPDDYSWSRFKATVDHGWLHNRLAG